METQMETPMETPVNRRPGKGDLVEAELLRRVTTGVWHPGSRIPSELELSEEFGVSRTSVRRAISRLTGRGILRAVQGGGTFVNDVLTSDYLGNALQLVVMDGVSPIELQEVRLILEPPIASVAALRISPAQVAALEQCIDRQEAAWKRDDLESFLSEDMLFHGTIVQSANNSLLEAIEGLVQELMRLYLKSVMDKYIYGNAIEGHRAILDCLRLHAPEDARQAMYRHLSEWETVRTLSMR